MNWVATSCCALRPKVTPRARYSGELSQSMMWIVATRPPWATIAWPSKAVRQNPRWAMIDPDSFRAT